MVPNMSKSPMEIAMERERERCLNPLRNHGFWGEFNIIMSDADWCRPPPNNFWIHFRVEMFKDQVLNKMGSIDFQLISIDFHLISIDFNWFSIDFNLLSIDFNWFSIDFNLFSIDFNLLSIDFNWLLIGFNKASFVLGNWTLRIPKEWN